MAKRKPTESELMLWQKISAQIQPLKPKRRSKALLVEEKLSPSSPEKKAQKTEKPKRPSVTQLPSIVKEAMPDILVQGSSSGIDRRQKERFRKGEMKLEGKLDLHGSTQAEAHAALLSFLRNAYKRGARSLLVITGKGRGIGKEGILRQALPRWLNEPAFRPMILTFDRAQAKDGGDGAFYILLKKTK